MYSKTARRPTRMSQWYRKHVYVSRETGDVTSKTNKRTSTQRIGMTDENRFPRVVRETEHQLEEKAAVPKKRWTDC